MSNIYESPDTIHKLGNLTLLPSIENSSISNVSWQKKRLMYKILSAETAENLEQLRLIAESENMLISKSTTEILNNSSYLPMVKAIASIEGNWTKEIIESRTARIADLAWQRIAPWLDIEV